MENERKIEETQHEGFRVRAKGERERAVPKEDIKYIVDNTNIPIGTIRLMDNNKNFGEIGDEIVPVIAKVGLGAVYFWPLSDAIDTHGYNVINPGEPRPKLGTKEDFGKLAQKLKEHGLDAIVDIVPNHMAASTDNLIFRDILKLGKKSDYWRYLDMRPDKDAKISVPFLGDTFEKLVDHTVNIDGRDVKEIRIEQEKTGEYSIVYWGDRFPVDPETQDLIHTGELSVEDVAAVHDRQHYRLTFWKGGHAGWKRFFEENRLIRVRIEDPVVGEWYWKENGWQITHEAVKGIRDDHPDGLYDPHNFSKEQYERFKNLFGRPQYVVQEKIVVGKDEKLPDWKVMGDVGYTYLTNSRRLAIDEKNFPVLDKFYEKYIGHEYDQEKLERKLKAEILKGPLKQDMVRFRDLAFVLAQEDERFADIPREVLGDTLERVIVEMQQYRTYFNNTEVAYAEDIDAVNQALHRAQKIKEAESGVLNNIEKKAFEFARGMYSMKAPEDKKQQFLDCIMEGQQLTGPLMALSIENTMFFRLGSLISRWEVGAGHSMPEDAVDQYHAQNRARLMEFPLSMTTLATHDTKLGQKAAMDMNVISEDPGAFGRFVWDSDEIIMRRIKGKVSFPDEEDRWVIYQAIAATLPEQLTPEYIKEMKEYVKKFQKEAKRKTSWTDADADYEDVTAKFIDAILKNDEFQRALRPYRQVIKKHGAINYLAQDALQMTAPGVPDMYQRELENKYSLVDPYNRQAVDWDKVGETVGMTMLGGLGSDEMKIFTIRQLLDLRRRNKELMIFGEYEDLHATGALGDKHPLDRHIVAFRRSHNGKEVITITPRLTSRLKNNGLPIGREVWKDARLELPPGIYRNIFTQEIIDVGDSYIAVGDIFKKFPAAVLEKL